MSLRTAARKRRKRSSEIVVCEVERKEQWREHHHSSLARRSSSKTLVSALAVLYVEALSLRAYCNVEQLLLAAVSQANCCALFVCIEPSPCVGNGLLCSDGSTLLSVSRTSTPLTRAIDLPSCLAATPHRDPMAKCLKKAYLPDEHQVLSFSYRGQALCCRLLV